ncbi:hypothetical protein ADU37_CDS20020 [Thermococcus sp. 2319x1]|nr:hypothetical protein ADU37_CDS20020 [Thermococcus sp. 2319x1]
MAKLLKVIHLKGTSKIGQGMMVEPENHYDNNAGNLAYFCWPGYLKLPSESEP